MPAAAVIPAPAAYIKFAAVKKLVVGFLAGAGGPPRGVHCPFPFSSSKGSRGRFFPASDSVGRAVLLTECRARLERLL